MRASTASSTTTTAASPFATGRPAASRSIDVEHRLAPGRRAPSRAGVTARSSVRETGGTGRSRLPLANAGPRGRLRRGSRRRLLAGRLAHEVDLDVHVGREALLDGDLERVRAAGDREALLAHEAAAAQGQDPLGGGEGRQHEDLRHVARPVLLPVGDERDLLLLQVAARRHPAAGHPDPQLGLVLAAPLVGDAGHDAPGAALLRLEARAHRLGPRTRASAPARPSATSFHSPSTCSQSSRSARKPHRAARDRAALEVGRDRVDHDGLALLHEGPLRAQAHVALRRGGRGGPPRPSTPAGSRP